MKVQFSVVGEFLEEIEQDAAQVEDGIVRVARQYQQTQTPPLMHLYVVAGVVVKSKVVELRQYCGQVFDAKPDEHTREVNAKPEAFAQEVIDRVTAAGLQLGFDVRKGYFEP